MSSYRMKYKIGATEYLTTVPADIYSHAVINRRDEVTVSGTYTAPCSAWYKIILMSGGNGGGGGIKGDSFGVPGYGGSSGYVTIAYEWIDKGTTASVTIGAGGIGGTKRLVSESTSSSGGAGGATSVTVKGKTYTASSSSYTLPQMKGVQSFDSTNGYGGTGGGFGGGTNSSYKNNGFPGTMGGGGGGGYGGTTAYTNGGAGGNGFVWFLCFDPNKSKT